MNCENQKCKKKIVTIYSCNKCNRKYCSHSCMIEHVFESHQNNWNDSNENFQMKLKRKKNTKSPFIIEGEYLNKYKKDKYYDISNMEVVKIGKKLHLLGSGAFSDVYLAKNKIDGKFFAIKKMEKEKILDTGAKLDMVLNEIEVHLKLAHPNIIKLNSYNEDKESFHLVLEYCNSGTLFSVIKKNKGLTEDKAFKYFIQTAAAVNFIHENNLVHRDIKPENLLIDENDNIKLCDFGWCAELSMGTRVTFCGTYEYMAPEIIKEMPYNCAIDVWSLGILLYELTHGYSPFRAKGNNQEEDDYAQIFKNIVKYKFKIDKDLSENCKDLITKLLSPDISSRIKVRDIFSHPWVVSFEENYQKYIANNKKDEEKDYIIKEDKEESFKSGQIKSTDNTVGSSENLNENNKSSLNTSKNLRENSKKKSVNAEESIKKIKDNLEIQKKQTMKDAIEKTAGFNLLGDDDNLFDKVLTKVQSKNKDKRKKSNMNDLLDKINQSIEHELSSVNLPKIKTTSTKKIIEENDNLITISDENKPNPFSILDEIKEMDDNLNRHYEELNNFKNKTKILTNVIDEYKGNMNFNQDNPVILKRKNTNNSKNDSLKELQIEEIKPKKKENTPSQKRLYSDMVENITLNSKQTNNKPVPLKTKNESSMSNKSQVSKPPIEKKVRNDKKKSDFNEDIYFNNEPRLSKIRRSSAYNSRPIKDLNKELDLEFLPKDLLYNERNFNNSKYDLVAAIELLEKAQENKNEIQDDKKEDKTGWEKFVSFINPFKCG